MNKDLAPSGLDNRRHAPGKFKIGSRWCGLGPQRPWGTSSRLQPDPERT